jgi:GxxExxY protein
MINAETESRRDAEIIENLLSKSCKLRDPMRLDILVDSKVIIEVKATETILPVYKAQVLTYLRLTNLKLGLVINFGQGRLIDGWKRVVNNL